MHTSLVRVRTSALVCALAFFAGLAEAQQPKLPRGDASGTVGWLHSNVSELSDQENLSDRWASRRATLNGQLGFYWTEHWKTELAAEQSNVQRRWQATSVLLPDGNLAYRVSEHQIDDTRVSVGQFYQFGHNAWAHLLVGTGINVTRRHTRSDVQPLIRHDRASSIVVEQGYSRDSRETQVSPFVTAAVKAYMTPRVFMRSDVQADFTSDLQAVVMRIGVGVDF